MLGSLYSLMGTGLTLIWGIGKVWDYSQAGILAIGAYLTWWLVEVFKLPWSLAVFIVMGTGAIISVTIERNLYNRVGKRTKERMIVAYGAYLFIENLLLIIFTPKLKTISSPMENFIIKTPYVWIPVYRILILIIAVISYVLLFIIFKFTMMGKALRATAQNPIGAELAGINTKTTYSAIFAIGAVLSALSGMLLAPIYGIYPNMGYMPIFKATIVMVLGGLGEPLGSIIAGFILGEVEAFCGIFISTEYFNAFAFVVLIITLMFRPYGLLGKRE
jgi:branched-chain amino acid transport system permease protein